MKTFAELTINPFQLIIIFLSISVFSQEIKIEGHVKDSLQNPVAIANVVVLKSTIKTTTNQKGSFSLVVSKENLDDTLQVSCIGYRTRKFLVRDIKSKKAVTIILSDDVERLRELDIKFKKKYTIGTDRYRTRAKVCITNSKDSIIKERVELGRKYNLGSKNSCLLDKFSFYISGNSFKHLRFKINVYEIKSKDEFVLIDQNIFINIDNELKNWISIDLKPFNIVVENDIIITLKVIETSTEGTNFCIPIIFPSVGSTMFYRKQSETKWNKFAGASPTVLLTYYKL